MSNVTNTEKTVTKIGWAQVNQEDARIGAVLPCYMPYIAEPFRDRQGNPIPEYGHYNVYMGPYVQATIIGYGAHWTDKLHGQAGYYVRVEFQVSQQYRDVEFV